jgi:hypothetical protein
MPGGFEAAAGARWRPWHASALRRRPMAPHCAGSASGTAVSAGTMPVVASCRTGWCPEDRKVRIADAEGAAHDQRSLGVTTGQNG